MVAVVVVGSSCRAIPLLPPATIRFTQLLCLVLIICIHLLPLVCSYGSNNTRLNNVSINCCPEHERQALQDMVTDFGNGDHTWVWGVGTNCCQWSGIGCDRRTGHVVRIDLSSWTSNYQYPRPELNLNNSLLALEHLHYLDLSDAVISSYAVDGLGFIGSFQNLRYLNLSYTYTWGGESGDVGFHHFGNLSRLRTLSLRLYDDLDNGLQIDDPGWLSRLTSLQQIELGPVNSGPGWVLQALSMLPSIRVIRVQLSYYYMGISSSAAAAAGMPSSLNPLNFTNLSVLDLSSGNQENNYENSTIPSWLSSLTRLRHLRLRNCNLGGGLAALWNLSSSSSLEVLDLSSNQLQGSIPNTWGSISMLRELHLSNNNLSGSVPQSLGRLTQLEILDLSSNSLTGTVPQSLGRLSQLVFMDLSRNSLTGTVPQSLGSLSQLVIMDLSGNSLTGTVPQSLGCLSRLVFLNLSSNSLTGILTEAHFANLSSLKHLVMSDMNSPIALNISSDWHPPFHLQEAHLGGGYQVTGGQFPRWLRTQLQSLSTLDISNTGIQDNVPDWFWIDNSIISLNLSHNAIFGDLPATLHSPSLESIDLSSNRLHGPLPQHFVALNLRFLDLSNNSFSGPISNIIVPHLQLLLLSKNNFTGKLPAFICRLDDLGVLDLADNHLTGELPDCLHQVFVQLMVLDLSGNNLSGGIPDNLGKHDCRLNSLYLSNNNLSGEIPSSLSKCYLNVLDLAYNEFTGNIAIWLGDSFPSLSILRLRSNKFYGFLPPMQSQFELKILDLSNNNLSGTIPPSFGNFPSMTTVNDAIYNGTSKYFADRVLLWMKGKEHTYDKMLKLVVAIDLSHNDLSGTIPEQLASLVLLKSLNLSNNHLTGKITTMIGRMQQLESLDFSYNKLSGPIPPSLANLSSLGYLNLSYNNLSGRIPTGGHLDTFQDPYVYWGNPFLNSSNVIIGKHPGDTTIEGASIGENTEDDIDEKFWLYNSIAPGFVVGIWAVLGPLLFKKAWRYAYFRAMDTVRDKILCRQS